MSAPLINVVISDLHCGSDVGLMPEVWENDVGNEIKANPYQRWLSENFHYTWGRVLEYLDGYPFILTVNGDAIEGIHHRSTEMVSQKWEEHLDIAIRCIKPYSDLAEKIYITKGTECHTQSLEDALARELGASEARNKWLYEVNGCLVDAAHHMTTSSRAANEASAYSIQMTNARVNYQRVGHRVPSVFLRAHRHAPGVWSDCYGTWVVTGAWQLLTRFGYKAVTDSIPTPTIAVLDWSYSLPGELPIVHQFHAIPPQSEIEAH